MTSNITNEYNKFTSNVKNNKLTISGIEWNYYTLGQGSESFLILTGGGSIPEASFQYANALSEKYKVIIPALPQVYTMADCVEGVNQILIQENIANTNFLGFSMGGMISQCFVRKYPDKVKKRARNYVQRPPISQILYGKIYWFYCGLLPGNAWGRLPWRGQ